jgi:Leucine-rich repeat (LRR) protein
MSFHSKIIYLLISLIPLFGCNTVNHLDKVKDNQKTITRLNLSYQNLTEIPAVVFEMENLKVLNLNNNKITEIPAEIGNLIHLEKLILSNNKIVDVADEIGHLKALKRLSLRTNKIDQLPASIGDLESLEVLKIGYNQLVELPDELCQLKNLTQLYTEYNRLEFLPREIGTLNLTDLFINQNNLIALPNSFYDLTSIIRLNISNAGSALTLKEEFCKLRRIEQLIIDHNTLTFAPRCLEIRARSNPRFGIVVN